MFSICKITQRERRPEAKMFQTCIVPKQDEP
jgi:hypothetical protein